MGKNITTEQKGLEVLESIANSPITGADTYERACTIMTTLQENIEKFREEIKKNAIKLFEKNDKLAKVGVGEFVVTRVKRGTKRAVKPLKKIYEEGGVGVELIHKIDTKALNEYIKDNGKLPEDFVEEVKEYYTVATKKNN